MIFQGLLKKSEIFTCSKNHRLINFEKWLYNHATHTPIEIENISFTSEHSLVPLSSPSLHPQGNHSSDFYHPRLILPTWELHKKATTHYMPFSAWRLLPSVIFLQPVHMVSCIQTILIYVSFQDTFDKERQKESVIRDRNIHQLDADLNTTRNQLNQVQDE